ncbi:MAG: hypothetical protein EB127_05250 [Alphaproteobacteria bacterium]|nr:hypothetical protein [Alphaproteobacteria bacterium]
MKQAFLSICMCIVLSSCARDLSSSTYTSDSTLNMVFQGRLVSMRHVNVKETDSLSLNTTGSLMGAALGGAAAYNSSRSEAAPIIGAVVVGALVGSAIEGALGTSKGVEYFVKIDTSMMKDEYYQGSRMMRNAIAAIKASGMVTVVQSLNKKDPKLTEGQKVLVIISEKRARVIPSEISE